MYMYVYMHITMYLHMMNIAGLQSFDLLSYSPCPYMYTYIHTYAHNIPTMSVYVYMHAQNDLLTHDEHRRSAILRLAVLLTMSVAFYTLSRSPARIESGVLCLAQ